MTAGAWAGQGSTAGQGMSIGCVCGVHHRVVDAYPYDGAGEYAGIEQAFELAVRRVEQLFDLFDRPKDSNLCSREARW